MAGETNRFIGIEHFGKDHWSLLAYVECRCVGNDGVVDHQHLRINPERHVPINRPRNPNNWEPKYGTRLKGYFLATLFGMDITDHSRKIEWHDDWDCMEDLEGAGLVKTGTYISGIVRLTEKGQKIASQIRDHKARGGAFATFELKEA